MTSAPPPSPLAPGFRLDRYELICPIAEGGMASVWIARQTGKHGFKKLVAIKTILPKYASDPRFQGMFRDEARIASRIEHVNVAQILDVGEQHDVTYLVMEYVDGDALSRIDRALDKSNVEMPLGVLLRVMADVCGGLHAAHELRDDAGQLLGVVHRDVSPQNVLVSTLGLAKLIDFGIAKARDRMAGDTRSDQLKGKVHYMAPEQALGWPMDRRADVWAVGAVLYHMLAGKPPYEAENDIQTIFRLASGKAPAPLPDSVPAPVAAVVSRALSHEAHQRYATAAELQQAIEQAMAEAGATTTTTGVAAFLEAHVSDRAKKRKETIALGLKAADEREKYSAMMQSNAEKSGPSSAASASQIAALTEPEVSDKSSPGGTLGLATITMPLPVRSRGMTLAIVGAAAGLAVGIAGMMLVRTGGTAPKDTQSSATAMQVEPAAGDANGAATVGAADPAAATSTSSSAAPASSVPSAPTPAAAVASSSSAWSSASSSSSSLPAPTPHPRYVPRPRPKPRVNDGF